MTSRVLLLVLLSILSLCAYAVDGALKATRKSQPVCGDNSRCCKTEQNNMTHCKNTTNEEGKALPCPNKWSCVCDEGYMMDPSDPDSQNCIPDVSTCPAITTQCPDVQQVMCDGTNHNFSDRYQYVEDLLAPLRYYISYSGNSDIIISTCNNANYDTKLALFDCDAILYNIVSGGSQTCNVHEDYSLFYNDDGNGCSGGTSVLQIPQGRLPSGTYAIGVYGVFFLDGSFTISISC